jgi:elongation factor Tu
MSEMPTLNVMTIGHQGHGKSTLTAALCTVLAKRYGGVAGDFGNDDQTQVSYATANRIYAHTDLPAQDILKHMIASKLPLDAGMLVVSAMDGLVEEVRAQIWHCRRTHTPYLCVFLNMCDMVDDEHAYVVEWEIREALSECGYAGEECPIIRGSALGALNGEQHWEEKIIEFMTALEAWVPAPQPIVNLPLLLPIQYPLQENGQGTVILGDIHQGTIRVGDTLDIVGLHPTQTTSCAAITISGQTKDSAQAGETAEILLSNVSTNNVERGRVVAPPNSLSAYSQFECDVYILTSEESGRHTVLYASDQPGFRFWGCDVLGAIELPAGEQMVMPGSIAQMGVTLVAPMAMKKGSHFSLIEGGRTVGFGVVVDPIS